MAWVDGSRKALPSEGILEDVHERESVMQAWENTRSIQENVGQVDTV